MDAGFDYVLLSRLQFAVTAMFHILWPILTVGLSLFLVLVEALWLKTRDPLYYHHARFWGRLLLLIFGIGVVSGIPLQFEFGTNWSKFAYITGDFIGNILGFEASMAFMLEAGFIGIMMFGWQRVPPPMHFFATCMVATGASLSAFWIMVASAWMQTPAGVHLEAGRFMVDSYFAAIFNPAMFSSTTHMWLACLETSVFVIGGISAWYILKNRHRDFFLVSFRIALLAAAIVTPLQILMGHNSGVVMAEHQPAKFAASEAHWKTNEAGEGAPWALLAWPDQAQQRNDWSIDIPFGLSLLATNSLHGEVVGLEAFARDDQPPVWIPFVALRIMVAIGFGLLFLSIWTLWVGWKDPRFSAHRRLLKFWVAAIPFSYIAVEMGWLLREVGRQPWVVQGLIRTVDTASTLPASLVASSLITYSLIYTGLLTLFLIFARRLLRRGPDLTAAVPQLSARKLPCADAAGRD